MAFKGKGMGASRTKRFLYGWLTKVLAIPALSFSFSPYQPKPTAVEHPSIRITRHQPSVLWCNLAPATSRASVRANATLTLALCMAQDDRAALHLSPPALNDSINYRAER